MLTKNIIIIKDNFLPIAIANPSRITDKTIPISTITINNSVIFNKNISATMPNIPPIIIITTKVLGTVQIALPPICALTIPTLTMAKK